MIDDNGDGKGTPGAFYRGVRPVKAPAKGLALDGGLSSRMLVASLANSSPLTTSQRNAVEEIEAKIELLRSEKGSLHEVEYYKRLEGLLLKIVEIRELRTVLDAGR